MGISRLIDLEAVLQSKSCFLFGPRQTGKSYLIDHTLKNVRKIDLLESETFRKFNLNPEILREEIRSSGDKRIVIDEIQKIPQLLDEVHYLIERLGVRFLLTGSSPRKLKSKGVNLLGGRARIRHLLPFSAVELKKDFNLLKAINHGLMPSIYGTPDFDENLGDYVSSYLQNEIANEGATRNVPAFSRFLEVAAHSNAKMLNYSAIASDSQVKVSTVVNYFEILEDTLMGFRLEPWKMSKTRKAISTAKFYFFDSGVCRNLQGRQSIAERTPEFGDFFETYILHEVRCYQSYKNSQMKMNYWRSTSQFEVDLILNECHAIEVKAKGQVGKGDIKGLKAIQDEKKMKTFTLVTPNSTSRRLDHGIEIISCSEFLSRLWGGEYE